MIIPVLSILHAKRLSDVMCFERFGWTVLKDDFHRPLSLHTESASGVGCAFVVVETKPNATQQVFLKYHALSLDLPEQSRTDGYVTAGGHGDQGTVFIRS